MKRLESWKQELLIGIGFLLLPLLLYAPVTLGNKTMIPADNLFQWQPWASAAEQLDVETPQNGLLTDLVIENYAWKRFFVESVKAGEIPLWQPYLFGGSPFLATGQHSMLYPFSWLFLILPIAKAYGWYTVSQLWLAGALMYGYGRVLSMRRSSAFIAGLIYQGSGFMLASAAVFPMIIGAAAWLPLLLACIEKIINDSRLKIKDSTANHQSPIINHQSSAILWAALGAVALGMQILAGHIEITYYTLLIMALYALWRLLSAFRSQFIIKNSLFIIFKPAAWLLAMVLLGLLLGSVQLIPFVEVGQANFRQGSASFAEVQEWAFKPRRILTLVLPNFFGSPSDHEYVDVFSGETVPFQTAYDGSSKTNSEWGLKNYVEGGIYLGILPLFLAVLGVAGGLMIGKPRRSHTWFFTWLGLLSLAFIFGTPLYALVFYGLPFANQLHTPFRWVFPLSLCVAALAGFGFDSLRSKIGSSRNLQSLIINLLIIISFGGGIGLLVGLFVSRLVYGRIEPIINRIFLGLAGAATAFPDARAFYSYEFRQFLILGVMLIGTGIVLWLSQFNRRVHGGRGGKISAFSASPRFILLPVALIILDLYLANVGFNAAVNPALLDYKPELVQWLEQQPGYWRITSFAPNGDKPFNANSGWLFDIQDVRGYDSIIPKPYTDYMAAIEPQNELQFNRVQPIANWESLNSPLLDVLGVKYIITAETIDLPKLKLVWEGEGLRVYENLAVAPRAYTLPLTSTAVTDDPLAAMTEYDPRNHVIIDNDSRLMIDDSIINLQSSIPGSYQPATIDEYSNIQVVVSAEVNEPSWLVLNDSYAPGWKAWIRPFGAGENAEIQVDVAHINGNFRGIVINPTVLAEHYAEQVENDDVELSNAWTVRFRYSPASFQLGALASAMGGVILLFALGIWGWRRVVKDDAELTTTRSLAKNSAAPIILNIVNKFIDFAFAAFYLRFLGPVEAGSYATAIATAGIFDIISNFGLNILLTRDVSQDRSQASRYLLNTSVLRLGTGLVGALPVLAWVGFTHLSGNALTGNEVTAVLFIMVGMVFSGMAQGVTGLFYVYEKAEVSAAMTTVTTILKVGFGVLALMWGFGFVGLAAVSILTNVITLAVLIILAFRNFELPGPWRVNWALQRQMIRKGYPLMLIHLLQTIFISIDVLLLRNMLENGAEVVGWYNSAYKWFNALQIVPSFFTLALFPVISREIQRSMDAARRMYRLSLKLMLLLALPIAVVITFWATPLTLLLAGEEFLPYGAIALQIVVWSIPFGWLNSVTNYVLIALGLERMQPRAFAVAVAFNIIANLLTIKTFSYIAASVTTILSELVLMALFAYYLRKKMPGMDWGGLLVRPLLAAAIMTLITYLGGQIYLVVGLVLGLVAYPASLWFLRVLGEEERHILRSILPSPIVTRLKFLNDA